MPPAARNPANWDQYDGRPSPTGSMTSSAIAEEQALLDDDEDDDNNNDNGSVLDAASRAGAFINRRRYNALFPRQILIHAKSFIR